MFCIHPLKTDSEWVGKRGGGGGGGKHVQSLWYFPMGIPWASYQFEVHRICVQQL